MLHCDACAQDLAVLVETAPLVSSLSSGKRGADGAHLVVRVDDALELLGFDGRPQSAHGVAVDAHHFGDLCVVVSLIDEDDDAAPSSR